MISQWWHDKIPFCEKFGKKILKYFDDYVLSSLQARQFETEWKSTLEHSSFFSPKPNLNCNQNLTNM